MKYPASTYANALAEAIAGAKPDDSSRFTENFLSMLRKNGDEAHLPGILEEAERLVRRRDGTHRITFESARPLDGAQKKEVRSLLGADDASEEKINPELIAGVRVIVDDERQFDGSLKGKLDEMFG